LYVTYLSVVYFVFFFFFNDPATTEIYTLSLHDALPISTTRRNPLTQRDFMFPFAQTKPSTAALPDPSPLALSCSLAGAPLCLPGPCLRERFSPGKILAPDAFRRDWPGRAAAAARVTRGYRRLRRYRRCCRQSSRSRRRRLSPNHRSRFRRALEPAAPDPVRRIGCPQGSPQGRRRGTQASLHQFFHLRRRCGRRSQSAQRRRTP